MSKKAPAFQFYPSDWLSSKSVMLMTPAEEGAYIRLLAIAWSEPDCGLPDDDIALAALSRLGPAWKKGSGKKVRKCFISRRGRLYNKRLLSERKKQEEWKLKSSEGGKKGAEARWGAHLKKDRGGHKMVITNSSPNDDSSSSSSSSFKNLSFTNRKEGNSPERKTAVGAVKGGMKSCLNCKKAMQRHYDECPHCGKSQKLIADQRRRDGPEKAFDPRIKELLTRAGERT